MAEDSFERASRGADPALFMYSGSTPDEGTRATLNKSIRDVTGAIGRLWELLGHGPTDGSVPMSFPEYLAFSRLLVNTVGAHYTEQQVLMGWTKDAEVRAAVQAKNTSG